MKEEPEDQVNEVVLTGRVNSPPLERHLPSGDALVTFRLVIPRDLSKPKPAGKPGSRTTSDWVDCTVWMPGLRKRALGWKVGDQVQLHGALRRRFFRVTADRGAATRVEVEVLRSRLLKRATVRATQSASAQVR